MTEATSSKPRSGNGASTAEQNDSQEGIVDKLRNTATAQLTNQKNRATDGLGSIANAVRQSTQQLRDQQHDVIAGYVDQAADQIEQLSQRLRDRDIAELFRDLQNLSRRQPGLFVGGAFALGFVAARFLKSSARDERRDWYENAGPRTADSSGSSEYRGYANASGQTYPETAGASTVHDYSSSSFGESSSPSLSESSSPVSGSSFNSESSTGDEAADADANTPETGARRSRSRRGTTQTERP